LAKVYGPVRLGNEIQRVRSIFKYGHEAGILAIPARFGPDFRGPTKSVLRKHRNTKGLRMFTADELRTIIAAADQPIKSMVLLAANTGFGNTDLATLPLSAIDLDGAWVHFPRPKTGIPRRVPLWPETVASLREWLAKRPKSKNEADARLCYITKYGQRFVRINEKGQPADVLGQEFTRLTKDLDLHRDGLGFYAIRHGFETIGGATRDQVAVDAIMGHAPDSDDMSAVYRESVGDDRLVAVVNHVRGWLWPASSGR
jgi:integrase